MKKRISLDDMLTKESSMLHRDNPEVIDVLFDTNAFRWRYGLNGTQKTLYKFVLTQGVLKEIFRHLNIFPISAITDFMTLMDPEIKTPFMSYYDEHLIGLAIANISKRNGARDIGWVDAHQISYALRRARNKEKTILISDDGDILSTVSFLRKKLPHVRKNVRGVSVARYLERRYEHHLQGLEAIYRKEMIREINSQYMAV